jgi:hypothetical protein
MGKENIGEDRINSDPGAASASPGTDTATGTAKDTSAAASPGTGTGTGTRTRTRTRKTKEETVPAGLVAVEPAQLIEIELPEPPPEKKTSKKKKAPAVNEIDILTANVEMVGAAAFGLVGMVTQQPEIWEVSEPELKQIAAPAARIIERSGQLETTNKYSDYIMLFGAVALIIIPRIMAQKMINDQKKVINDGRTRKTNDPAISEPGPATIPGVGENALAALYE